MKRPMESLVSEWPVKRPESICERMSDFSLVKNTQGKGAQPATGLHRSGTLQSHSLSGHIGVLEPGSGIEEDNAIRRREES